MYIFVQIVSCALKQHMPELESGQDLLLSPLVLRDYLQIDMLSCM